MVRRLAETAENLDLPSRVERRAGDHFPEERLLHQGGAREGKEKAARPEELHPQKINVFVRAGGALQVAPGLGETGRIENDEIALRVCRNVEGYELALYGYRGYWKSPGGMDPDTWLATFPRLSVYGASARGNVLDGIGNVEVGYYDSRDDRSGKDPLLRNSEFRALAGYEQEVLPDFNAGLQYYIEWMMDHGAYRRTLPSGIHERDEVRHVLTLRLTRLLMSQNLNLSCFIFYSPSDGDAYLRPKVSYKVDDHWYVETGVNGFIGKDDYSFFGQFENNTNLYVAVRYSF